MAPADWVLTNGNVLTCNPRLPRAQGIAIGAGRILALGPARELRSLRGRQTRWVDLQGATVMPGIVDAHAHMDREGLTMPVGAPPFYLNVPECLAERRMPDRHDLDAAAPDHPVYIRGIWGFWNKPPIFYAANSIALRLAGI